MENQTHDPYAWIDRQIKYWQQKSREASEAADIDAFNHAEPNSPIIKPCAK